MKRRVFISAAALCLCLFLCACSPETQVVGTWSRDTEVAPTEVGVPFDSAVTLTFRSDGTATAEVPNADGTVESQEYRFTMTDDTLTLTTDDVNYISTDEMSYGILYELDGDTLSLNPTLDIPSVFTRD